MRAARRAPTGRRQHRPVRRRAARRRRRRLEREEDRGRANDPERITTRGRGRGFAQGLPKGRVCPSPLVSGSRRQLWRRRGCPLRATRVVRVGRRHHSGLARSTRGTPALMGCGGQDVSPTGQIEPVGHPGSLHRSGAACPRHHSNLTDRDASWSQPWSELMPIHARGATDRAAGAKEIAAQLP